jgi:hypothetical protein
MFFVWEKLARMAVLKVTNIHGHGSKGFGTKVVP